MTEAVLDDAHKEQQDPSVRADPSLDPDPHLAASVSVPASAEDEELDEPFVRERPPWLEYDRHGRPLASLRNVVRALKLGDGHFGCLRWSEFQGRAFVTEEPLDDQAFMRILLEMDEAYGLRPSPDKLRRALDHVAREDVFHPVVDWLTALKWDGEARLERLLIDRFGAEDCSLNRQISRRWLIGAVARVLEPGCKLDTMVVLAGPQGLRKSTACAALMPESAWFTDTTFTVGSKDALLQLQGVWLVEIGELSAMTRADRNQVKAFLSSRNDRFRAPYAQDVQSHPRQSFFVGTVNDQEFLDDPTGARRFWPVTVTAVDVEGIAADRDQLWAEAVVAYRAHEPWFLDATGEAALRARASLHEHYDAWEGVIAEWLEGREGSFTVEQVLTEVLDFPLARVTRSHQTRVGRILSQLGCRQTRPNGGARQRKWAQPGMLDGSAHVRS